MRYLRNIIALSSLCLSLITVLAAAESKKPNIVYILVDDAGYGDFGCYGQKTLLTPNVDQLASEGMKFTRHYAGAAVCAPARCVLMTGLHTGHSRVRANGPRVQLVACVDGVFRLADTAVDLALELADRT
jgi:membrane-anchored protein YejM (alkaline phosphatase superfamily)